jgi:hypothetical protein
MSAKHSCLLLGFVSANCVFLSFLSSRLCATYRVGSRMGGGEKLGDLLCSVLLCGSLLASGLPFWLAACAFISKGETWHLHGMAMEGLGGQT